MKHLFLLLALSLFFGPYFLSTVQAEEPPSPKGTVLIKVGEANLKKSLMALTPFQFLGSPAVSKNFREVGTELYSTVSNDLDVSSYFQFIKPEAYLEDVSQMGLKPAPGDSNGFHFENWSKIGCEFVVRTGFTFEGSKIQLEAYVYHVGQAKEVLGKKYKAEAKDVRNLAHTFASDILEALTGKKGMFLSKLVVSSDKAGKGIKEIYVMDWDGNAPVRITNHNSIAISPAWSPDSKSILYTAFAYHKNAKTRNADLFSYELANGKRFLLSSRKGINSGSAYSPDGKRIFLTISSEGNPDIYSMNLEGEELKRITNGPMGAMNVEPAVSPDGKKIAFSSDRSGKPMLYIMNLDGSDIKRVTFAGKYNATPAWSPDSKKISFAGWENDHFDIFVMNADGTGMERLTSAKRPNGKAATNEDPSFSPDGRHIVFISNRTSNNQIYIVNADGSNERRITVDKYNYYKPRWSNFLD